jgi:hypothetical protein
MDEEIAWSGKFSDEISCPVACNSSNDECSGSTWTLWGLGGLLGIISSRIDSDKNEIDWFHKTKTTRATMKTLSFFSITRRRAKG